MIVDVFPLGMPWAMCVSINAKCSDRIIVYCPLRALPSAAALVALEQPTRWSSAQL